MRGGRQAGAPNYKTDDLLRLAKIVYRILPQGGYHWEKVANVYNTGRPDHIPPREATSLRERFKKLAKESKPTGDADCPEHVRLAKWAAKKILEEAAVLEVDDAGEPIIPPEELAARVKGAKAVCLELLESPKKASRDEEDSESPSSDDDDVESAGSYNGERSKSPEPEGSDQEEPQELASAVPPSQVVDDNAPLRLPGTLSADEDDKDDKDDPPVKPSQRKSVKPPKSSGTTKRASGKSGASKSVPQRLGTTDPQAHVQSVKDKRRRSSSTEPARGYTPLYPSSDTEDGASTVSETRKRRMKLDKAIDALSGPLESSQNSQDFWQVFLAQQAEREERRAEERLQREEEWRREERRREDERRREEQRRDDERRADQRMMMMLLMQHMPQAADARWGTPDPSFSTAPHAPAPISGVVHPPPPPPLFQTANASAWATQSVFQHDARGESTLGVHSYSSPHSH